MFQLKNAAGLWDPGTEKVRCCTETVQADGAVLAVDPAQVRGDEVWGYRALVGCINYDDVDDFVSFQRHFFTPLYAYLSINVHLIRG